jgi:hypothetical protein
MVETRSGRYGKMVPESPPEISSRVGRFVLVKDFRVLPDVRKEK